MADDVREGLRRPLKELSPKYFYDARGSELFDLITEQPEYYQTRAERSILNRRAPEIAEMTGARELVELGSGSASKTRALLFGMAGHGTLRRYVPVDVSETVVERCARELAEQFPGLSVHGMVGDFGRHLVHLPPAERRLFAFLGGTIGNLYPAERTAFLSSIAEMMGPTDHLLLGVDLVKDVEILEAAYNDAAGRDPRLQPQRAPRDQPVARGRLPARVLRPRGLLRHDASWIEMRLRAQHAHGRVDPRRRHRHLASRRATRSAPRSARSSRASPWQRTCGAPASSRGTSSRTRPGCSAWRWLPPSAQDAASSSFR